MRFGTNIGSLNVINHVDYHSKSNTYRRTDNGNDAEKRILSQKCKCLSDYHSSIFSDKTILFVMKCLSRL
ncbi:unknown [Bacteroides intestinalis CAG:564]|jgi:hypothetical protein|nr:unknown [Bacteroides intestinalis CAG:564]